MADRINGKVYDWTDMKINLPFGEAILISEIEYKGSLKKEAIYGKGGKVQGWGRGKYEASGSMKILREEFDRFLDWAKQQGYSILQIPPFPITVSYGYYGEGYKTDKLYDCLINDDIGWSASQGDTSVETTLNFLILGGIEYDGKLDYDEPR